MFVYIDESGSTGRNIADENRPQFYHLALLSRNDLDSDERIKDFLNGHKIEELHSVEKPSVLESASSIILQILEENNASFFFGEVKKTFFAYAKIFDTLFDNEENIGARWETYQVAPLRLMLFWNFIQFLDEKIAVDFYKNCLMASSQQQADECLRKICKQILAVTYKLPDDRCRQIIEDAINGAKYYGSNISIFEADKQNRWRNLPHIVSFGPMLNAISLYAKEHDIKVQKILHDEQGQVHHALIEIYNDAAAQGLNGIPLSLKENGKFDFTQIPSDCFEMKNSKTSYGIQTADVCLYVLIHQLQNPNYESNKYKLCSYIVKHTIDHFEFSEKTLFDAISDWERRFSRIKLSPEDIEKGEQIVKKMEKQFYDRLHQQNVNHKNGDA